MKKRTMIIIAIMFVLGLVAVWLLIKNSPASHRGSVETSVAAGDLESPGVDVHPPVAVAADITPTPASATTQPISMQMPARAQDKKLAPIAVYVAQNVPPEPTPSEDEGDYAPAFRMIQCKLTSTVDSNSESPSIDGTVTEDLWWRGRLIIPKCSEVHGHAQVDKNRERIIVKGAFTFVLMESDGYLGSRELVVKGEAKDKADDPEFTRMMVGDIPIDQIKGTWGITDGSDGLKGVVIKSNNADLIKLFVATFMKGIAESVQGYQSNVFGSYASPNGQGAGGVPGYIINPPAQGVEAVMDHYAQYVMDSIEKDGFFIRVPAGKQFYVRVTEGIWTGKAKLGGSRRITEVQQQYLDERKQNEKVTQPRSQREDERLRQVPNYPPIDPSLTNGIDQQGQEAIQQSEHGRQPTPPPEQ